MQKWRKRSYSNNCAFVGISCLCCDDQHFSTTLLSNTSLQHFSTTLLYIISLQHFSPTLLYDTSHPNTFLQPFSTTIFCNTSLQHSSPKLFSNSFPQDSSPTLLHNTSLQHRLCDYLQYHCILCSKHMSHTKAITAHMRSNHPAQLQEAIALGIQRMRQFTGKLSPCSYCMTSFNKTHLCPVFLQMAILELRAATPDDPLHFTCFLCQFVAADRAQLEKALDNPSCFSVS